ncbi:MAG TPA: VOC family protein [Candidatus Cybelea sp.]|jgi:catechol 2,3-dioxygenase-like lactoylglutathione lyase family enzyme|nr:VOC family protein [Candidatus Cybelea sp.]
MLHHVDIHVRNLDSARALFDGLADAIGYRPLGNDSDFAGYETAAGGRPRFGLVLDSEHRAGSMRIAFAVKTRAAVDAAARIASENGARAIEGPGLHPEYGDYYAVFFEDVDGNRFEIVAGDAGAESAESD